MVSSRGPLATLPVSDRLGAVIEENHRTLLDAVKHLSASTDALGSTMRSSVNALGEVMSSTLAQLPVTAESENPDTYRLTELQDAVEDLTTVLKRLTIPDTAAQPPIGAHLPARSSLHEPRLARELRRLLQEIEAAR